MATAWDDVRRALTSRSPNALEDPAANRAAVAMILRDGAHGLDLLFIRRAEHPDDLWSGQMAFPGGRAEPGETDLVTTAIRETAEEVGLDLGVDGECLGRMDEIRATARTRPVGLTITPFVFRLKRADAEATPGPEVRSIHWLGLDDLRRPDRRSTTEYLHDDIILEFPALEIDSLVIWGLTYRMFTTFEAAISAASGAAEGKGID